MSDKTIWSGGRSYTEQELRSVIVSTDKTIEGLHITDRATALSLSIIRARYSNLLSDLSKGEQEAG